MTNIEIAKTILKYVGRDSIEVDRALCAGVILLLDDEDESKTEPKKTAPVKKAKTKPKKKTEKQPFDVGKLGALRKAGWSVSKIADEMGVSEATIYKYMKQEGIF